MKNIRLLFCILLLSTIAARGQTVLAPNFNHLVHLTERITLNGDSVDIVHIYANFPDYAWVGAAESGEEGIACVDDAARAAILYLRSYTLTRDTMALNRALPLLQFVRKMETRDGSYYNFLHADHSINTDGKTSFKSFGWWAVRGLWCQAAGYRALKEKDPMLAAELKTGVERSFPHIDSLLQSYGMFKNAKGFRVPQWLLYDSGADVTAALMLGLSEYYQAAPSRRVAEYLRKFAAGLIAMQDGNVTTAPYGAHRSWETMWHMWGNDQTNALAVAGKLLRDKKMIASAKMEADGFYSRLLIEGFIKEFDLASDTPVSRFDQIAYGVRPMVTGLLRLFDATGQSNYLIMAGLGASWLLGNNAAGQTMYDSATGRCFDGIRDSSTINKNSGAESTIEALWTIAELAHYPRAAAYLHARKIRGGQDQEGESATFLTASGKSVTLQVDKKGFRIRMVSNAASSGKDHHP